MCWGLKGWQYPGRSESSITTPLVNTNPTQPEEHRPNDQFASSSVSNVKSGSPLKSAGQLSPPSISLHAELVDASRGQYYTLVLP